MSFLSLILISISLSIDIFIIAFSEGMTMKKLKKRYMYKAALIFGSFAGASLFLGWKVGETFFKSFSHYSQLAASFILFLVGIKMIYHSVSRKLHLLFKVEMN